MIEHEGIEYARVSEILALMKTFDHIKPEVLKRKADIGTRTHDALHEIVTGGCPQVDPDIYNYVASFQCWYKALKPVVVQSEQRYFDKERRLTGCIDCLIDLPNEVHPILVDFKTSAQECPSTWPLQANMYHWLLETNGIQVADRYLFIRLHKDGEPPRVHQYDRSLYNQRVCEKLIEKFWKEKAEKA